MLKNYTQFPDGQNTVTHVPRTCKIHNALISTTISLIVIEIITVRVKKIRARKEKTRDVNNFSREQYGVQDFVIVLTKQFSTSFSAL